MSLLNQQEKLPNHIDGFQLAYPRDQSYFGVLCDGDEVSPLRKGKNDQVSLFNETQELIAMSVSDFILAHKCPKVFNGYFSKGYPLGHPHHALFDIGTIIDRVAREYLGLPPNLRGQKQANLRKQLLDRVANFQVDHSLVQKLPDAFDDFCAYFSHKKLASDFNPNKKLVFVLGDFLLGGRIDFLIKEEDETLTLLDLKLMSVGNKVEDLLYADVLQSLLYAYALLSKNIRIDRTGYYYFLERTFVTQQLSPQTLVESVSVLTGYASLLSRTKEFAPRRCAYCLICQLRESCEIGRNTTRDDFAKPL